MFPKVAELLDARIPIATHSPDTPSVATANLTLRLHDGRQDNIKIRDTAQGETDQIGSAE